MENSDDLAEAIAFAQVLRELRDANQLTQETLSYDSGVDRVYISRLESGGYMPSLRIIFRLAKGLGIKASQLVALTEEALPRE